MQKDDLRICTGAITQKFVGIEQFIAGCISRYYFDGKENLDFILNVLGNEQSTFGLKRNVFLHLFKPEDPNFESNLGRLNTIRNMFAHAPLMHKGDRCEFYFRDAKNKEKPANIDKDPKKFEDEFNQIFPLVVEEFKKIAQKQGWSVEPDPIFLS